MFFGSVQEMQAYMCDMDQVRGLCFTVVAKGVSLANYVCVWLCVCVRARVLK